LPGQPSRSTRQRVAREAATLLYTQQEKEYKQAKQRAAQALRARLLPSNKDVAVELDKIADEVEGSERAERLTRMRKDALSIMVILGDFHPKLVGSVWRGTAHRNSDIDIEAFFLDPTVTLKRITQNGLTIRKAEWQLVTKRHERERAFHAYLTMPSSCEVELIVRSPEKMNEVDQCEIYGDVVRGLNIHQLRRLLLSDPLRRFVP
jgi:predicted nucleotidyltransferase